MKKITSINSTKFFLKNDKPFNALIWLGKNFILLAISDKDNSKIEVIESYRKEKGNITRSEALDIFKNRIVQQAKEIFIGLESKKFVIIPSSLYNDEYKTSYLDQLYTIENKETIGTQFVKPIDCQINFTLKQGTKKLLKENLEDAKIFHAPTALLIAYQQMLPPNKKFVSFIRLQQDEILITVFRDQQLQFHQSYSIDNLSDAYYYYLEALDQLKIDRKEMTLSVFGSHNDIDKFKIILDANINTVKYINRLPTLQYTDEIFSHPAHHFFNLFALLLCA